MPFGRPSYCEPISGRPPEPHHCSHKPLPVCPYCGEKDEGAWELGSGGEEDGETQCGSCNRTFFYQRQISVTYSTRPIIGPHPEEHR